MKREELITALGKLGYRLFITEKAEISGKKVLDVLGELAESPDSRLIEAFPVVLANCAHRGIKLDIHDLLSRYEKDSQRKSHLEKLILVSSDLLAEEGLGKPQGLGGIIDAMRDKYGDLLEGKILSLGRHRSLSIDRLRNALRRYVADIEKSESAREKEKRNQLQSFQLNLHLSILFSPKQKELVLKKLKAEKLSQTEREYFSRVVKKKLEALANNEVRKLAIRLTKK